jgi:hypothetical protein
MATFVGYSAVMKRALPLLVIAAALIAAPARAHAEEKTNPSVFAYAGNGFVLGAMIGLSAGYIAARDPDFEDVNWHPLVYGGGIGALAGGAAGLTLGIVDMARDTPGFGAYVLRDTLYGAGFGALTGGLTGGLVALSSGKVEHVAFGAAIGTLAGSALGIGLGVFEGTRAGKGQRAARPVTLAVGAAQGHDGAPVWMPVLAGAF